MLEFTDRARDMVRTFMDQGGDELQTLRIHVTGGSPVAPTFELTLVTEDDRAPEDVEVDGGGFQVLVDPGSASTLDGARVDFVERLNESGFEIVPATSAAPEPPSGPLAERVQEVLDLQVNPQIASHGGKILLRGVEGTEILIEMTGGCQGCAMSRATLRQGVERMIGESVPEVTAIHDVTDHAAGENPYFSH